MSEPGLGVVSQTALIGQGEFADQNQDLLGGHHSAYLETEVKVAANPKISRINNQPGPKNLNPLQSIRLSHN